MRQSGLQLNSDIYNLRILLAMSFSTTISKTATENDLTTGQGESVSRQDLVDGLEVGCATGVAVARASRGDTLGLRTRVPYKSSQYVYHGKLV